MKAYTKLNVEDIDKNYIYQNYHKHSMYTNVIMLDSVAYPEDYAKRAKELGHGIISSCEHGYQGRYIESHQMAEKYGLKYLFAVEAYMVFNRYIKDKTNVHIILAAKNENGRKAINRILSEANLTGFYYRARIDYDLIMTLPENDVWITTACLAGVWRYTQDNFNNINKKFIEDLNNNKINIEDIKGTQLPEFEKSFNGIDPDEWWVKTLKEKFGENFYLEVQAHNVDSQRECNKRILDLSKKYNIEIIAGVDSHYILEEDAWMRDYLQKSGHIFFEEEQGFYMDYPDGKTLYDRFVEQGVLSEEDIWVALYNTNVFLNVEEYTSPIFNHKVKMPSAIKYQHLTENEKNIELAKIVKSRWEKEKEKIPQEKWSYYEAEIKKELKTIFEIHHSDYFLLNYEIIKNAVENKGGMITFSGRGSGPSFYVNHLLGFTEIDRISCPITLYPERFLSASRIKAGSLADIDFNCGNVPAFAESQKEILGEEHAYPMLTFGLLKAKSAWKMYCRANDVDFEIANQISAELDKYEKALKYYDPESGDSEPQVLDYIPENLQDLFMQSKKFLGLVDHGGVHACGYLLLNEDIKEEVGIMRLKSKGGNETIVTVADGKWVEKYLMLKNDLLSVTCVKLIYLLYDRVGIPKMNLTELMQACKEHPEVWDIYKNGYTLGVNQLERPSSKRKAMHYKPHNISELSALVAGIRPAFKSLIDKLINRENFSYNLPTFDKLLQTEELPQSFILYQEQIMKVLAFAGIPMDDCYTVIKSISKKRVEVIESYQPIFLKGFSQAIQEQEGKSQLEADRLANQIWGIIQDASAYGFNSSHSLSVSFDSLLAAYFKALYPLEFYEVYLNVQMERADKARAVLAKDEAKKGFNIRVLPMRFGQDNGKFTAYPEQNALSDCLKSIKGFGEIVGEEIFRLSKEGPFIDFLAVLEKKKELKIKINETQMEVLIKLNYFEEFGKNLKLLKTFKLYNKLSSRKTVKKDQIEELGLDKDIFLKYVGKETAKTYSQIDFNSYIIELVEKEPDLCIPICEQLNWEVSKMDIPITINEHFEDNMYYVLEFKTYEGSEDKPYLILYSLKTGELTKCCINRAKKFQANPFKKHSIIQAHEIKPVEKKTQVGKEWVGTGVFKQVLSDYTVIIYEDKDFEKEEVKEETKKEEEN